MSGPDSESVRKNSLKEIYPHFFAPNMIICRLSSLLILVKYLRCDFQYQFRVNPHNFITIGKAVKVVNLPSSKVTLKILHMAKQRFTLNYFHPEDGSFMVSYPHFLLTSDTDR